MRCFYVLIHGRLRWLADPRKKDQEISQPAGLYCHRYVLASDSQSASKKACDSVFANLDSQTGWLREDIAELDLEVEEVVEASFLKAFFPVNRGHTFYESE